MVYPSSGLIEDVAGRGEPTLRSNRLLVPVDAQTVGDGHALTPALLQGCDVGLDDAVGTVAVCRHVPSTS